MSALNRIRVGNVYQREALDLAELMKERENADGPLDLPVLSLEEAARRLFNVRQLSTQEATDISFGRRITAGEEGSDILALGTRPESQHASTEGITAAFAPDGTLVALIENVKFRGTRCAAPCSYLKQELTSRGKRGSGYDRWFGLVVLDYCGTRYVIVPGLFGTVFPWL